MKMTDQQHPLTPPPELVQEWRRTAPHPSNEREHYHFIATSAAQWAAEAELDACCEYIYERLKLTTIACISQELRAARRPKPPSLAEEALEAARIELTPTGKNGALIIKALERLQELEEQQ